MQNILLSTVAPKVDFTPVISSITDTIGVTEVLAVIGLIMASGMVFVFMWFGVRKIGRALLTAITKGKISL